MEGTRYMLVLWSEIFENVLSSLGLCYIQSQKESVANATVVIFVQCGRPAYQDTCKTCGQRIGGQGYKLEEAIFRTWGQYMWIESNIIHVLCPVPLDHLTISDTWLLLLLYPSNISIGLVHYGSKCLSIYHSLKVLLHIWLYTFYRINV